MTTQTELTLDGVQHRMAAINAEVEQRYNTVSAITTRAQDDYRDLNEAESAEMRAETTKLAALRAEIEGLEETSRTLQIQQRSAQIGDAIARATGRETRRGHSPLVVSDAHLRSHAEALRAGSVYGAVEDLWGSSILVRRSPSPPTTARRGRGAGRRFRGR